MKVCFAVEKERTPRETHVRGKCGRGFLRALSPAGRFVLRLSGIVREPRKLLLGIEG